MSKTNLYSYGKGEWKGNQLMYTSPQMNATALNKGPNFVNPAFFPERASGHKKRTPFNLNNFDHNILDLSNRKAVSPDGGDLLYTYEKIGSNSRPIPREKVFYSIVKFRLVSLRLKSLLSLQEFRYQKVLTNLIIFFIIQMIKATKERILRREKTIFIEVVRYL